MTWGNRWHLRGVAKHIELPFSSFSSYLTGEAGHPIQNLKPYIDRDRIRRHNKFEASRRGGGVKKCSTFLAIQKKYISRHLVPTLQWGGGKDNLLLLCMWPCTCVNDQKGDKKADDNNGVEKLTGK